MHQLKVMYGIVSVSFNISRKFKQMRESDTRSLREMLHKPFFPQMMELRNEFFTFRVEGK